MLHGSVLKPCSIMRYNACCSSWELHHGNCSSEYILVREGNGELYHARISSPRKESNLLVVFRVVCHVKT